MTGRERNEGWYTIPARIVTLPSQRTLEVLRGRNGLFNEFRPPQWDGHVSRGGPFALERAPFRLTRETLTGEDEVVTRALEILSSLAPRGANWLAVHMLDLGENRGVWKVRARWFEATRSRRLDAQPLVERGSDIFWATCGLPRMPDGMHRISNRGGRRLLRRSSWP